MKLFLKKIGVFLLFSSLIYGLLLFIFGTFVPQKFTPNLKYVKGTYGFTNTRLQEVKAQKKCDVLVLGSSHAYRGFDPRIFQKSGLLLFNLGSSAQTPLQTKLLLERYLNQMEVGTIIYEVYPTTFAIDGVESSLDIIANDKNDIHSLALAKEVRHMKVANTLAFGFMDNVIHPVAINEPKISKEDRYIPGGFVERKQGNYQPKVVPKTTIVIDPKQWEAFTEVVELIKRKKIKLLFVFAPITKNLYQSYQNRTEFETKIKALGSYFNCNGKVALDDHLHFYDSNHLNQEGVNRFNTYLLQYVVPKLTQKTKLPQ
ncbi:MAG: hypothetical protein RLZZ500_1595 [Bacteroidota bacterium]|jgi:hypothetical protein